MKECPYCLACLDDNEAKCPYCGYKFSEEEKPAVEEKLYSVLITNLKDKKDKAVKVLKHHLNCELEEAEKIAESGLIEGLSKKEAELLASNLRNGWIFARAIKTDCVAQFQESVSNDKTWEIKLLFEGEGKEEIVNFLEDYFLIEKEEAEEHINLSVNEGDGMIIETDSSVEAEEIAEKLRAFGAELAIQEVSKEGSGAKAEKEAKNTSNSFVINKKNLIIGVVVGVAIVLTLILLLAR